MVGQQHIERTLRNAVAQDSVAHAYLFTGPRGTGKTTSARLLAKALMCEQGPTENPDGTCAACQEINEGNHPDVIELDAASRNGVEAVRTEIIERVFYAPQRGAYKVYIIDEVHMLSTNAFNAMLKTLEEPPSHVMFVLCTTDPQKVPATIQSRCQRFDFHPINSEQIAARLQFIAQSENIKVDAAALAIIAKHAEGGMRDAITALESLASFTGNDISVDDVEGMLGEVSADALADLMRAIARRNTGTCFTWVAGQVEMGADLPELVRNVISYVRDMYVLAVLGDVDSGLLLTATADNVQTMQTLIAEFEGPDRIARMISLLSDVSGAMRYSTEPRTLLEVALIRLAQPENDLTLDALAERIERLEQGGFAPAPAVVVPAPKATPAAKSAAKQKPAATGKAAVAEQAAAPAATQAATAPATPTAKPVAASASPGELNAGTVKRSWRAVLADIKKTKASRYSFFADTEVELKDDGSIVVLWPKSATFKMRGAQDNIDLLQASIKRVLGTDIPCSFDTFGGESEAASPARKPAAAPAPAHAAPASAVTAPAPAPSAPEVEAPPFEEVPDAVLLGESPAEGDESSESPTGGDALNESQEGGNPFSESPEEGDLMAKLAAMGSVIMEESPAEGAEDGGAGADEESFSAVQTSLTQEFLAEPEED